jgi:predicted MPP superfamily phosphohydrolase
MVVSQINATEPDLIVIAGDLVDGPMDSLSEQMEPLGDLTAAYGVVMTMGNHDSFLDAVLWMDYFTSLGITVLANDALVLHRGDQRLEVLGIHDHYAYSGLVPDLTQALQAVDPLPPTDPHFRILVAHQPLQVFSENNLASRSQISLHLSGHTHGGQLWPIGAYTSRNQPFMSGVHDVDGITVVTSRGVGNWLTPARVGAEPEIILLSLSAASPPAPDSLHDDTG